MKEIKRIIEDVRHKYGGCLTLEAQRELYKAIEQYVQSKCLSERQLRRILENNYGFDEIIKAIIALQEQNSRKD